MTDSLKVQRTVRRVRRDMFSGNRSAAATWLYIAAMWRKFGNIPCARRALCYAREYRQS